MFTYQDNDTYKFPVVTCCTIYYLQKEAGPPENCMQVPREHYPHHQRQFEDLVQSCKDLLNPDIGYDEGKNFTMVKHQESCMQKRASISLSNKN